MPAVNAPPATTANAIGFANTPIAPERSPVAVVAANASPVNNFTTVPRIVIPVLAPAIATCVSAKAVEIVFTTVYPLITVNKLAAIGRTV